MMARKGEGPPFELGELLSFGVASTYTVHLKHRSDAAVDDD